MYHLASFDLILNVFDIIFTDGLFLFVLVGAVKFIFQGTIEFLVFDLPRKFSKE